MEVDMKKLRAKVLDAINGKIDGTYYLNRNGDFLAITSGGKHVTYAFGFRMFNFKFTEQDLLEAS